MHTDIDTHVAYTSKHTEIQYIFTYIYNMYIYTYKRMSCHVCPHKAQTADDDDSDGDGDIDGGQCQR